MEAQSATTPATMPEAEGRMESSTDSPSLVPTSAPPESKNGEENTKTTEEEEETQSNFRPASREEWTLVSQGAEAKVWKVPGNDGSVTWICKERFSKAYRHPDLDKRLTNSRCRSEGKILEKCTNKSDIRVPKVIRVVPPLLYLEFLDCPTVKAYLKEKAKKESYSTSLDKIEDKGSDNNVYDDDIKLLAENIGILVAKLHNLGVIHGDLTTSNMMMKFSTSDDNDGKNDSSHPEKNIDDKSNNKYELVLIDFGLAKSSQSIEEKAVDLYVLERAFQSTHPNLPEDFFDKLLKSYDAMAVKSSEKKTQTTLQRLEQVRARGRKRECFG